MAYGNRSRPTTQLRRRLSALFALAALPLTMLAPHAGADTKPPPGVPVTITADPLPTWQTDGVVWSLAVIGDVIYAGGNFDHIRPPGTDPGDPREQVRRNLAAFNAATGEPLPWAPVVEGTPFSSTTPQPDCDDLGGNQWSCDAVWEIRPSPDGTRLYVGGDFTKVNNQRRGKIASFELPSGTLTSFQHEFNSRVKALAVARGTVYAGGFFTSVDGTARQRLAAFTAATGALTGWAPTADRSVHAMLPTPDGGRIILGGDFNRVNGRGPHGLASVRTDATGTSTHWETGVEYFDDRRRSWVTDLVTDGEAVYASANGESTFDGRLSLNIDDGTRRWIDNCQGATQALTILDGLLYSGSHAHDCSTQPGGFPDNVPNRTYQRLLAEPTNPDPQHDTPPILHWFPTTNGGATTYNQGPRAMDNDGRYVWVGGDFTTVNQQPQQGLTRFGSLAVTKDVNPPEPVHKPTVTKPAGTTGTLTVNWTQTWDRDNAQLIYQVIRDDNTVIHTVTESSTYWDLKTRTFTDTGLAPGSTHTYSVRAIDPFDNRFRSARSDPAQAG
ncbi:hypothetical protein BZB76_6681 [Actinomadura pelletieri DSM 43383]|uniref:Fibronectin type-III domain-containing protein n=1 Tax=Actinomadura pelletieri DSM 43383 TaxID=1120940 RepID=A0A495QAS3_9ACTN|nr:hypothetical protein [Actinomadura pelletieri]RKS68416.1 hypothetical protein BZB76_6681 [Actinomadura pelletieri DSM 43383]